MGDHSGHEMMKMPTKGMWEGALIWGLGVPFLLAIFFSLGVNEYFYARVCNNFINFMIRTGTGPISFLTGMWMGHIISHWRQRNENSGIIFRSAAIGSVLCVLVEFASITCLILGAHHVNFGLAQTSIVGGFMSVLALGVMYSPLALIIGAIVGAITALLVQA